VFLYSSPPPPPLRRSYNPLWALPSNRFFLHSGQSLTTACLPFYSHYI
jgi:hypothetical protein